MVIGEVSAYDYARGLGNNDRIEDCSNFYDWFCSDSALPNKKKSLDAKVRKLVLSPKINATKLYVWYKNNCPMNGPLYDDIRFADLKTGKVVWNITPKSGHTDKAEVYYFGEEGTDLGIVKHPVVSGTWDDVLNYFGVK